MAKCVSKTYRYEAMTGEGRTVKGRITATDEETAILKIRKNKLFPTFVAKQKSRKKH